MDKMTDIVSYYNENMNDVTSFCDQIYLEEFAPYFDDERRLYKRLESTSTPITDAELEDILTNLPLRMFTVSEKVSQLRIKHEVVKIGTKEKARNIEANSSASTQTARKEEAAYSVLGDQLLAMAYSAVLERVEKEISYSRELIMSAKKIWDARRNTDGVNPVSENTIPESNDVSDLPEYPAGGRYIKGV